MKVPDKIWLTTDDNNGYVFTQKRTDNKGIEYIRKDALLEKIEKSYERMERLNPEPYNGEDYEAGFIDGFDRFRSYIKSLIQTL